LAFYKLVVKIYAKVFQIFKINAQIIFFRILEHIQEEKERNSFFLPG